MVMHISSCCGFFFTTPSRETPASSRTEASMAALVRSAARWRGRTRKWEMGIDAAHLCIRVLE